MTQIDRDERIKDLSDRLIRFDGVQKDLTERIIGCAFTVHNALGPGFVEMIYENALSIEFERKGILFKRQCPVDVSYAGTVVGQHRLDMLVEDMVVVELKAKDAFTDADIASVLSYLKATDLSIALMLNFGTPRLQIKRLGNMEPKLKAFQNSSVPSL